MIGRAASTISKMKHLAQAASTKLKEIKMPPTAQPMRIDTFLAAPEYFHLSRTQAQKLIDNGDVFVNGSSVLKKSMHVKPNDNVSIAVADLPPPKPTQATIKPQPTKAKKESEDYNAFVDALDEVDGEGAGEGEGDEADELESGPTNATGPLVTPIDILCNHNITFLTVLSYHATLPKKKTLISYSSNSLSLSVLL